MIEEEKDAKLESSTSVEDAKPDSSTGDPIETDAAEESSTEIAEESETEQTEPSVQNQIGELTRRLEESEAEKARGLAIIEELSRGPADTPAIEADTFNTELEALGIDPDVARVLKKHRDKGIRDGIETLKAELAPLQESLVGTTERSAVMSALEARGSDVLKSKENEIHELINSYDPKFRAKKGAAWVAQKAIASVVGENFDELMAEDRKARAKKGKSSKRIISDTLSDASIAGSEPVDGLTKEQEEYVTLRQSQGSDITKEGYLAAVNRSAAINKKALGQTI